MENMNVKLIIAAVEQSLGKKVSTPKDFEQLSHLINHRTRESVSASSLKRIWGYIEGGEHIRTATFDILCRFAGYRDTEHFLSVNGTAEQIPPSKLLSNNYLYTPDLTINQHVRLTWQPGRVCDIQYQGDASFIVLSSEKTKLQAGATFRCYIIEQGEQMYISHLRLTPSQPDPYNYVCGLDGGILYEVIEE